VGDGSGGGGGERRFDYLAVLNVDDDVAEDSFYPGARTEQTSLGTVTCKAPPTFSPIPVMHATNTVTPKYR
jgi:hypothetical protein